MKKHGMPKDDSVERVLKEFYIQYPYCLNTMRDIAEQWSNYSTPSLVAFSIWQLRTTLDFQRRFTQFPPDNILAQEALEFTVSVTEALFSNTRNPAFRRSPDKALEIFESASRLLEPQAKALARSSANDKMLVVPSVQLGENSWLDIERMIKGWKRAAGICEVPLVRLCARIRVWLDRSGHELDLPKDLTNFAFEAAFLRFQSPSTQKVFDALLGMRGHVSNRRLATLAGIGHTTVSDGRAELAKLGLLDEQDGGRFALKSWVIAVGYRATVSRDRS